MIAPLLFALALQLPTPSPHPQQPYWQQDVHYDISAKLDEAAGTLAGTESVEYVNHSPDTLTTFALHLYLNAFRPGSRWADADSVEHRRRFNDLQDPDYGFNHVRDVRIMGQAVTPIYPFAPDSTVVRFDLPHPLPPGGTMKVEMDWDARPSTVPRRQGRQGRRLDFAQWYPKVVVYDRYGWEEHPLYPAGEFYGEFGTFLVKLDVPEDQVMGSTGVPLCGDPGWAKSGLVPADQIDYQRNEYPDAPHVTCESPGPGRKRVVWYAEQVHHFAISFNPEYRYEQGEYNGTAIHVLYLASDSAEWGHGTAVKRVGIALAWLAQLYGPFAWPQMTALHRIEGGGTEFPMMVMLGGDSQGLILHEVGHNYTMGILANNEWREGFMDEGFTSFQTSWFWEVAAGRRDYPQLEASILQLALQGKTEPTDLVSEDYSDFVIYNLMIYNRGDLFFQQLRYIVGDSVMRRILQTFYSRWKLHHVTSQDFENVAEEVSGRDLSTFFGQWLHSTDLYDYSVGRVHTRHMADGGWETRVEVVRQEDGRIPVDVAVLAGKDTVVGRVDGLAGREWITIATAEKPHAVVLDPTVHTHDWDMLNNRRDLWLPGWVPPFVTGYLHRHWYLDTYFSRQVRRDQLTAGIAPTVWYNDAGGVTLGLREREDYLGMFEDNQFLLSYGTGWSADNARHDLDYDFRFANPVWWRHPGLSQIFEGFRVEGRSGVSVRLVQGHQDHLAFGGSSETGLSVGWLGVTTPAYLDRGFWDDGGTFEAQLYHGVSNTSGPWNLGFRWSLAAGAMYGTPGPGIVTTNRYDLQPYGRATLQFTASRSLGKGFLLGARLYAGWAGAKNDLLRQRRIFLAGADPYERMYSPFLRSRGALLMRPDFYYHQPGGGNMRGYDPRLAATKAITANVQLERNLLARPRAALFQRVALTAFGDLGWADGDAAVGTAHDMAFLGDAGVGIEADHRIGQTRFATRFDLPLYVSRPELAQDRISSGKKVGFRWLVSFEPGLF